MDGWLDGGTVPAAGGRGFILTYHPNTQRPHRWERPAQGGEGSGSGSVVEVLVAKHRAPREAVEDQFKDMCVRACV